MQSLQDLTMQTQNVEQKHSFLSCLERSSSSSYSALIGDYIGMESCLDYKENDDLFESLNAKKNGDSCKVGLFKSRRDQRFAEKKEKKEFPPPIPLLARTENLPCHMPWVLKRYYTSDGRLILKEERVKHHGYFRAHRSNGRLTLQLVSLDNLDYYYPYYNCPSEEKEGNNSENVEENDELENGENEMGKRCDEGDENGEEEEEEEECVNDGDEIGINGSKKEEILYDEDDDQRVASNGNNISGNNNVNGFKSCFNYNTMAMRPGSTCIFEMPMPTIRPIHT